MRRSSATRKFIQESLHTDDFSLFDLLHGYVYTRWTYLYIAIGIGEHRLAKIYQSLRAAFTRLFPSRPTPKSTLASSTPASTVAEGYHGKVLPPNAARQLVSVGEAITLKNLEKILPYNRARDLILQNPERLAVLECPCRAARPNPCTPLDVCLIVGEPFVSMVLQHHPRRARSINSTEAVEILEAEHARGHVHHAFFKDAMLNRFFAICNCCACCCGAMQAQRNGTPMLAASGYVCVVEENLCGACGECEAVCPFDAIHLDVFASVDVQACMGCEVCVSACPQGALALVREPLKGEPLEIERLVASTPNPPLPSRL